MDFRYQDHESRLNQRDASETSFSSNGSNNSSPVKEEGEYSPLPAFAEQTMDQLSLVEPEPQNSNDNNNMDTVAYDDKSIAPNNMTMSRIDVGKMDSDQKHKRPVQAMKKSWSQLTPRQRDTNVDYDTKFFTSRNSFWAIVAAHGLPSAYGPPVGTFELSEEMGGAWRCRKCMYLDGEVWFMKKLRSCPRCVFPHEPYKSVEIVPGEPFGGFQKSTEGRNPAWWAKYWKTS